MQFAGRFDLTAAPETLALCRSIANTYSELALERVREEWFKWASKSARPSSGMRFLRDSGWLRHFPEAALLIGVPQDPGWHPEGDVWTHTLHCLDALAEQPDWQAADEPTRIVVMLAVLAHDFAKPACTHTDMRHGSLRIVSPGHEMAGGPLAESFLQRLGMPEVLADRIPPLVANHLAHLHDITPRSVRRLAQRLSPATIRELSWVMVADAFGRPPLPRQILPSVHELLALAAELDVQRQAPRAILLGRHLVERGLTPGPTFKPLLDAAFEAQLDGIFTDLEGAQAWLDRRLPATAAQPA
jgi:tRNA nucleotidyltransferase (CCA-adding enzyme)